MQTDPAERIFPIGRKTIDFIESCCLKPIFWDTDKTLWDTTNEVWGITYYITAKTLIYIGPE